MARTFAAAVVVLALAATAVRGDGPDAAPPPAPSPDAAPSVEVPPCDDVPMPRKSTLRRQHGPRITSPVGQTKARVSAGWGTPSCQSEKIWQYHQPRGCAYERDVITMWFRKGRVARVAVHHQFTGQECMDADGIVN